MRRATLGAGLGIPLITGGALSAIVARRLTGRQRPDKWATPTRLGLSHETVTFATEDGVGLVGWFIPAPSSRGAIILCSGHSGSMDPDLKYVPPLHQHGYDVLMFDYRGHGRSGGSQVSLGCRERLDVLAAIDYLRQRGIERIALFGLSMGGAVAMLAAPLSPTVYAVISDSGFARQETIVAGWLRGKKLPEPIPTLVGKMSMLLMSMQLGCRMDRYRPIQWVDKVSPRGLLLIYGADDPFVPTNEAWALFERAGDPKELWIQPGAGHREIDQVTGEMYWARIFRFLDPFFPVSSVELSLEAPT